MIMNTQFKTDSLESKLFALGQSTFESLSDNDVYAKFPESFQQGKNNGRAWNARNKVAQATGWKMRQRASSASNKTNNAVEHKASMAISATFKTAWNIHMSACEGMPVLFAQESPEQIVSDLARDWLQDALLADKPNQFILSCSMANQATLENDFRFLGVESKAMRETRLSAEKAQRDRDFEYVTGLERKGYVVVSPDNSLSTGIMASLSRLETLVAGIVEKSKELGELKANHKKLSASLDKVTGDDLTALRAKLSGIEAECSSLAERIRRANDSASMIAGIDYSGNLVTIRERLDLWIAMQSEAVSKFAPLANKANDLASKVIPPSQQYTAEQEKLIANLVALLGCDKDRAVSILKTQGKLG